MKKVRCINDKNMFAGANIKHGDEYIVTEEFMNNWGQKTYILEGVNNGGVTPKGLTWRGYDSIRFSDLTKDKIENKELNFALN